MENEFGEVEYNGIKIILTQQASRTNHYFPGSYHDTPRGEEYCDEFWARGIGEDGATYEIVWHFAQVRGEESGDDGDLDWSAPPYRVTCTACDVRELAARIREDDMWDMALLSELCTLAGMQAEWEAADGENFEQVAYAAAAKLGVKI